MSLPTDDFILLSFVNTGMRDTGCDLQDFCLENGVSAEEIITRLARLGYGYSPDDRAFKRV